LSGVHDDGFEGPRTMLHLPVNWLDFHKIGSGPRNQEDS